VSFHKLDSSKIPIGYGAVDVNLVIAGKSYPCAMVAGVIGMRAEEAQSDNRDSLRPVVGWWMYDKVVAPPSAR
jgi:hypothetical protein